MNHRKLMDISSIKLKCMEVFHPFLLFLLFICTILFILRLNRARSEKPNLPPSPPKLPIIGNFHQLGTLFHHSFQDLSKKYGPLMLLHLGYTPHLIVSSPEMAKEITKTHDISFANRPFTTAAKTLFYGCTDIGFAPYGEYWRQIRKIAVLDLLSLKRVSSFKFIREEEVADMITEISCFSSTRAPVNLSKMMMVLPTKIISRCAFGVKLDGQTKFGELSRELMTLLGYFSFEDLFPCLGWIDIFTGLNRRMKYVSKEIDMFLDGVINDHIDQTKDDDQQDFVDILLHGMKHNIFDINITHDNIKAILLDMFVGGGDTSSTILEWAMAELMKNPDKMKKAQQEIRGAVGNNTKVDEDDIYEMAYLKSVIKETLRLHPALPLLAPRECYTSVNIKDYYIPPNTKVMINVWAIQRDPKLWDRAEEFIPERFIDSATDFKGHDYEFIPFGSGRRGCPGMSFGVAQVEYALANLLYWFDWMLPGDANKDELDMTEAFGFTVNKLTPLILVAVSHFS